jgi:hypothetical protein
LGIRVARDPSGRITGGIERDPQTWPLARRIAELLLSGESGRTVAAVLNSEGITSPKGMLWSSSTVLRLATSATWAGLQTGQLRRSDAEGGGWRTDRDVMLNADGSAMELLGGMEARVVTPAERAQILALVTARAAETGLTRRIPTDGRASRGKRPSSTLLAGQFGVLCCAVCGHYMEVGGVDRVYPNGLVSRRTYRCSQVTGKLCAGAYIPLAVADQAVTAAFLATLSAEPDGSALLTAVASRLGERLHPENNAMRASAQAALDDATAELARVQRLAVLGVLDEQEAVEHSVRARQAVVAAQRHLDTLPRVTASAVDLRRRLDDWYRVDETGNPILNVAERRALLGMAIRRVTVARIGRIGRARYQALPMSSRLRIEWTEAVTAQASLVAEPAMTGALAYQVAA